MREEVLDLLAEICEDDVVKEDLETELFESGLLQHDHHRRAGQHGPHPVRGGVKGAGDVGPHQIGQQYADARGGGIDGLDSPGKAPQQRFPRGGRIGGGAVGGHRRMTPQETGRKSVGLRVVSICR